MSSRMARRSSAKCSMLRTLMRTASAASSRGIGSGSRASSSSRTSSASGRARTTSGSVPGPASPSTSAKNPEAPSGSPAWLSTRSVSDQAVASQRLEANPRKQDQGMGGGLATDHVGADRQLEGHPLAEARAPRREVEEAHAGERVERVFLAERQGVRVGRGRELDRQGSDRAPAVGLRRRGSHRAQQRLDVRRVVGDDDVRAQAGGSGRILVQEVVVGEREGQVAVAPVVDDLERRSFRLRLEVDRHRPRLRHQAQPAGGVGRERATRVDHQLVRSQAGESCAPPATRCRPARCDPRLRRRPPRRSGPRAMRCARPSHLRSACWKRRAEASASGGSGKRGARGRLPPGTRPRHDG